MKRSKNVTGYLLDLSSQSCSAIMKTYKKTRNKVQDMIKNRKKNFVVRKLNENIGKAKRTLEIVQILRPTFNTKIVLKNCSSKRWNFIT